LLRLELYNPLVIHSSLLQEERLETYDKYKGGTARVIVATDVFGRGIDFEKVNLVVNFDFPRECETYLHRAGRAGRFGKRGNCISFLKRPQVEPVQWPRDDRLIEEFSK
jgi:superfamily II DNA/RNA helicase